MRSVRPPFQARCEGRRRARLWVRAALLTLLFGCDGSGQRGSAFVALTVESFSVGGTVVATVTASASQATTTAACVTLRNTPKNPTVTAPTGLDDVAVQSYTVTVRALDGRILVEPFTVGAAIVVPSGTVSAGTLSGNTATFGIVLIPAGRKPGGAPLVATAEVVFRGRDGRGSSVEARGAVALEMQADATDSACSVSAS
jgi:hypothetical protein